MGTLSPPVSYTHLDVYKRQLYDGSTAICSATCKGANTSDKVEATLTLVCKGETVASWSKSGVYSIAPVSYTHLQVRPPLLAGDLHHHAFQRVICEISHSFSSSGSASIVNSSSCLLYTSLDFLDLVGLGLWRLLGRVPGSGLHPLLFIVVQGGMGHLMDAGAYGLNLSHPLPDGDAPVSYTHLVAVCFPLKSSKPCLKPLHFRPDKQA